MLISVKLALILILGISIAFGVALMLAYDKISHLRELMRLRMTEGGKVRVTAEEQAAVEYTLRHSNLKYTGGTDDYRKADSHPPAKGSQLADLSVTVGMDTSEASQKITDLQVQADNLLATVEKCKGACAECQLQVNPTLTGKDLVAITRLEGYRQARTS